MKISKTHHKTKDGKIKRNPKKESIIIFVCVEHKGKDAYYEDEHSAYGTEYHTIEYDVKVVEYKVRWSKVEEFVKNYLDRNSDNPPYDHYAIKLAYWKDTKEPFYYKN